MIVDWFGSDVLVGKFKDRKAVGPGWGRANGASAKTGSLTLIIWSQSQHWAARRDEPEASRFTGMTALSSWKFALPSVQKQGLDLHEMFKVRYHGLVLVFAIPPSRKDLIGEV